MEKTDDSVMREAGTEAERRTFAETQRNSDRKGRGYASDQLGKEQSETNRTMSQINTQTVSSSSPSAAKVLASNQSSHRFSIFVY